MGTWDTSIKGNDTFQDVHEAFLERYSQGEDVKVITAELMTEFANHLADMDDRHPTLFALAVAQWEVCELETGLFNEVKEIIESGKDLELWKSSGADEKTLRKRDVALRKLFAQLCSTKAKPRSRRRRKFEYRYDELVNLTSPDGQRVLSIGEGYVNGKYENTSGVLQFGGMGSGVLHYQAQGRPVSAEWLDNWTIEIKCAKDLMEKDHVMEKYQMGYITKIIYTGV